MLCFFFFSFLPRFTDNAGRWLVIWEGNRGFLLGPIIALRLGAAFVPVRKVGKLPGDCLSVSYKKEYGTVRFYQFPGYRLLLQLLLGADDGLKKSRIHSKCKKVLLNLVKMLS